jgi:uncharacterized cupredoxin-like copper-binding protein
VKSLVKTLIAVALLSLLAACGTKNATQDNTSVSSSTSAPTPAKEPSDSGTPSVTSSSTAKNASGSSTATATKINATLKEMTIQLSSTTVPAGAVEFFIKNDGKVPHEFVVLKNDLKDKKLPFKGDKLDEDAKGLKKIGEVEDDELKSGATQALKVNLTPGRYLIVCNIGNHFKEGMKTELTVK